MAPREAIQTDAALRYLAALLRPNESVWFVAEDWSGTKKHGNYWLYETTAGVALQVLGGR